jgi:hypothetical protein
MIIYFKNKIYVDTNIPCYIPNMGEHIVEFYQACSRGARLNKTVVVIKPEKIMNESMYNLIPVG